LLNSERLGLKSAASSKPSSVDAILSTHTSPQYAVLLSSAPGIGLGSGSLGVQITVLSCLYVMVNRIFRQLVS